MEEVVAIKWCSCCKQSRPTSEFCKDKSKPDGLGQRCRRCSAMSAAKHRNENKEAIAKRKAEYGVKNKEKIALYRQENKERRAATNIAYMQRNADTLKEKRLARYAEDPEKFKAIAAKYRAENPEKRAEYKRNNKTRINSHYHNRRARKVAAGGSHTYADIEKLILLQKNKCPVCRVSLKKGYHVDHIIPLFRGGTNDIRNIQILCPTCNLKKGSRNPIEFMQSQGFLL